MSDVIDAEVGPVEVDEPVRTIVRSQPVEVAQWSPRMVVTIDDAVAQVQQRDEFMHRVMRKDLDYGVIPGTGTKPTLLKPGAERLLNAYGLHPELDDEVPPTQDFTGAEHGGEPFFQFRTRCRIWRQTGPGEHDRMLVAQASGECNSFETKYRYRKGGRKCPQCNAEAIIKGKAEYGGGWLCFAKKGGCGAKFADNDTSITRQSEARVANEDVADVVNTLMKMSQKRALIAATIIATGWSDLVTQDIEDAVATNGAAAQHTHASVPNEPTPAATGSGVDSERRDAAGLEPGEREFRVGDLCPTCHELADSTAMDVRPGKFKIARGGQHKGQLECAGKVGGQYANHPAPVTQSESDAAREQFGDEEVPW